MNIVQRIEWRLYKERKKIKLKNLTPTIIASNCNGEFIYYDMNLKFRSPTINLSFEMNDYVKMLENLEWYMKQAILPYEDERFEYPTGMLGDIEIRFNHYETLEEGIEKWEERKKRIDWNNLFIMGIDGDDCTYESLKRFDALPFKNKVIFTHKQYPEIKSAYYIPGFEDQLVGVKKDDNVDVVVTFPEDYHAAEFAGKEATFKVKIHEIKAKEIPELDDEFVQDVSEFDTVAEYKDSVKAKLEEAGMEVLGNVLCDDDSQMVTDAINEWIAKGAEFVVCTGGMSVDPDDRTPLSIRNATDEVITYGAPVLPGAMFMLAYKGEIPVAGLPGCVMYARRTIFDLVLPRIAAGERLSVEDFTVLGEGVLCLNCEVCTYPNCGFGK